MTEQALDRSAWRAMLDAARLEYGNLLEELPEHAFSPAFEQRVERLLRRGDHPLRHQLLHAAACLLLVRILSGCAVLAVSPEAREVFAGWVRETYETNFVYRFFGNEREEQGRLSDADVSYQPAYVPEGYEAIHTAAGDGLTSIVYRNGSGHIAVFTYFGDSGPSVFQVERESVEPVPFGCRLGWVPEGYEWFDSHSRIPEAIEYLNEDGQMLLLSIKESDDPIKLQVWPNEGGSYKRISVSGTPADLYLSTEDGNSLLIWTDEEEGLVFILSGILTEEALIRVAEYVEKSSIQLPPHRPGWIPEGYVRRGYSSEGTSFKLRYDREGGAPIWFRYGENGGLQAELRKELVGLVPETVREGGASAQLYADADGIRHLVWEGDEPGTCFRSWRMAPGRSWRRWRRARRRALRTAVPP